MPSFSPKGVFQEYKALLKRVPSLLLTFLVLSVVSMNLLANKELFRADWIALDCGFLISWIPFLIMDVVCKVYGGKAAARLSIVAITINLLFFLVFKLVSITPGMWGAFYDTGSIEVNEALNSTIGGSSWIVLGSAFAMVVSSVCNSILNVFIARNRTGDNYGDFALRSFVSTALSQFVDNLVFALVVSVPLFGWSMTQVLVCSSTAAIFELLLEVLFSFPGFKLSELLKSQL